MVLQCLCHFYSSCTIGVCLYHAYNFCVSLQHRTVVVQVIDHGIEVYLKDGLVHLLFYLFCDAVESELSCTLNQYLLVSQLSERLALEEVVSRGKEELFAYSEQRTLAADVGTYADELVYATFEAEVVYLMVQLFLRHTALLDVAKNECVSIPPSIG